MNASVARRPIGQWHGRCSGGLMRKLLGDEIHHHIYFIRGHRVMLDSDLATLYGVETKALTRAVRRNIDRFPSDFMAELTEEEVLLLRRQIGASKPEGRGGRRYLPLVFSEQGVAMLSSVLRSKRAIAVNIEIVRAFVFTSSRIPLWPRLSGRLGKFGCAKFVSCG